MIRLAEVYNDMTNTNKDYITRLYQNINQLPIIQEMEDYATEHSVPIMEVDGIELLKQLIRIHKPDHVLEIGTAIGYSAIQMALTQPNLKVTSIEIDEKRHQLALHNVHKANMFEQIHLVLEDASLFLDKIEINDYDFVFIDAAKGQYKNYVEKITPYLKSGSIIVIDNVLFKGYVSKEVHDDRKRLMKLGEKIDRFNRWLMDHPQYDTSFVETGDGVAIAVKR